MQYVCIPHWYTAMRNHNSRKSTPDTQVFADENTTVVAIRKSI